MWKIIKEQQYLSITKYFILGIILAVVVFQFVTNSIRNHGFDFNSLIEKDLLAHIISILIGGLLGGLAFVLMISNQNDRQIKDKKLWVNLKEKNTLFFVRNIVAFSVGGFVYKLLWKLDNITSLDNLFQSIFLRDNLIDYVGTIVAFTVFSIFLSFGIKNRLNLLYGN